MKDTDAFADADMPVVSIIIPMFNSKPYVFEAIESVINQSFPNWELILVDDCSKDDAPDIVKNKYGSDARIKLIQNPANVGAGISRNVGLQNARGRFVAFLDSDDVWLPSKLEKQLEHMRLHDAAIAHTSYSYINERGEEQTGGVKASPVVNLVHNMKCTEIGTSTAMVDTAKVGKIRFSPIRNRQDFLLWVALLGQGINSYGLSDSLVRYRVRKGQVSGNKLKMLYKTFGVYLSVDFIPVYLRVWYFCCYFMNAMAKRFYRSRQI